MPDGDPQFADLQRLLWRSGVSDDCSKRLLEELHDHFCDLVEQERARGADPAQAGAQALNALGRPADIAAAAAQRTELLAFSHRHPFLRDVTRGLVSAVAAPALPVYFCARRRECIARWCASVGLGGLLTAGLLLSMRTMLGAF
jgi:hypothetical protein